MIRLLLAILLLFSTVTVVVHSIMVYQCADQEARMTEEDTSEEKPSGKEGKEISCDKISSPIAGYHSTINRELQKAVLNKTLVPSKGFYTKPYNPPEAA